MNSQMAAAEATFPINFGSEESFDSLLFLVGSFSLSKGGGIIGFLLTSFSSPFRLWETGLPQLGNYMFYQIRAVVPDTYPHPLFFLCSIAGMFRPPVVSCGMESRGRD